MLFASSVTHVCVCAVKCISRVGQAGWTSLRLSARVSVTLFNQTCSLADRPGGDSAAMTHTHIENTDPPLHNTSTQFGPQGPQSFRINIFILDKISLWPEYRWERSFWLELPVFCPFSPVFPLYLPVFITRSIFLRAACDIFSALFVR